jgi:hypothetical protein
MGQHAVQRSRHPAEIQRVDEQGRVSDLPSAAAAHEATQLLLRGPPMPRGLLLERAERSQVTLSVDHLFHSGGPKGADQLVLQVCHADEETEAFHIGAAEIGTQAGPFQAAPEVTLLARIAEASQSDAMPLRAEPFEEASDVRRTSDGHDGDALGLEIPLTPLGQRLKRGLVAVPFDEHDRTPDHVISNQRHTPSMAPSCARYAGDMSLKVSWRQALAWRMERHLLNPIGALPVAGVVRRLCGVQAQVASSAELAVRVRRETSRPGEVGRALSQGRLIKTWAMRGTLHLFTPEEGGAFLSLIAAGRPWERPSWQRYFGLTADMMDALRATVQDALDGSVLTRDELAAAVVARRELEHIGEGLRSGWGTLLKPLAWQGDLCHGPSRGGRVTFMRPEAASSRWSGVPDPDEAAAVAIVAYFGAYGPATIDAFGNWLAGGWFGKRQLRAWFASLADRLVEVEVDGERAHVLAEHVDGLATAKATPTVRLLPGFDQYVLGPGTGDGHVVPAARRAEVSKQSGWISPVVVAGGAVRGTWTLDGELVRITWFGETGRPPRKALEAEVARLSSILDRDLRASLSLT